MKRFVFIVALLFACASLAFAQNPPVQQFNQDFISSTQCVSVPVSGLGTGSFGVSGTWTGTLSAQGIVGQAAAVTLLNATANGSYTVAVSGYTKFQVCGNTVSSGSAFVQVYSTGLTSNGAFAGAPNTITVGGSSATFLGSDLCQALANALNGTLTSGQKWGGVFHTEGFTGTQACGATTLNNLNAALQQTTGAANILLGCPLAWYLPVQTSQAATVGTPPVGMLNLTPYDNLGGCNAASVADNQTTRIIACPPSGVTGCPAPQSLFWPITSTVASTSGATINDRAYIQVNASGGGMVIVGGDPFTIDSGSVGAIAGSFTACQVSSSVPITGFAYANPNITFTNTGTNGLSAGSLVTLSGFSGANAGLNASWTVASSADGQHFVINFGAGFGGSTAAGTAQTGNTSVQNDSKCPFNPTPTTVYAAIENGILATSITNAGSGGTCNNIVPTWGAGCIINPELHITCSGGAANGAFIKHAGKCTSTPTISGFTDTLGGTVPVGLAISVFTAQSAAGSQATGNCTSGCGLIHQEIPIVEVVDNSGTNQNAPMGAQIHDLILDTRQSADVICYRDLGGNEHTRLYAVNCAGVTMRGIDRHSKQTNSGDEIYSFRAISGKLPNQATPPATSGTGSLTAGVLTTTAGNGFFYGLNVSGNPACVYAVNTPIYLTTGGVTTAFGISTCGASATVTFSNGSAVISGIGTTVGLYAGLPIHFATTGTLPTGFTPGTTYYVISTNLGATQFSVASTIGGSAITAGSAGSGTQTAMAGLTVTIQNPPANGTYSYYIPGVDLGTECVYGGGGFGHGLRNYTCDYSSAVSQYDYPYISSNVGTAVMRLPNCGLRLETNYFGTTVMDGHTERSQTNICAGLGQPVYGLNIIDSYGEPNAITNITGQFQNYHPTNIKFFNDYWNSSLSTVSSQQYSVTDAPTSFNSYYSLVDDNPVGPAFTAGPADVLNLSQYMVEWSAIQTSGSNTLCSTVNSTVPGFGNFSNCPQAGFFLSGNALTLSADTAGIAATTPATANQTFTLKGFFANQTYRVHCSGTTVQNTAGAGIGISAAAVAPVTSVSWNLHAQVSTSATATAGSSSGVVTNSATATSIYAVAAGTLTTELPWSVDGYITVGANAPSSFIIGFYTQAGADTVVVKQGSYCSMMQ
jgi:hypothetical protein